MHRRSLIAAGFLFLFFSLGACQTVKDSVQRGVERGVGYATEREVRNRTDRAVSGVFRGIDATVACVVSDTQCIEEARANDREVVLVNEGGEPVDAQGRALGGQAWANYNFVAGNRTLFQTNFSTQGVGTFPSNLGYQRGTLELVDWQGERFLRGTGNDGFVIALPDSLPEHFTVEFAIHDPATEGGTVIDFLRLPENDDDYPQHYVNIGSWRGSGVWSRYDPNGPLSTQSIEMIEEQVIPIQMSYNEGLLQIFAGQRRITNVPQADVQPGDAITFRTYTRTDRPIYISDIRVAAFGAAN